MRCCVYAKYTDFSDPNYKNGLCSRRIWLLARAPRGQRQSHVEPDGSHWRRDLPALGLGRLDLDLVQEFRLARELSFTHGIHVEPEDVRQHVHRLLAAQRAWVVCGHGDPDSLRQLTSGRVVPTRCELTAGQSWRHVFPCQRRSVTRSTLLPVDLAAACGLLFCVHTV